MTQPQNANLCARVSNRFYKLRYSRKKIPPRWVGHFPVVARLRFFAINSEFAASFAIRDWPSKVSCPGGIDHARSSETETLLLAKLVMWSCPATIISAPRKSDMIVTVKQPTYVSPTNGVDFQLVF